ncbi:MAG: DUF4416 family protein [Aquificae bacterium]|nr:DUF4416 family protein [Aquificota bacterium]
MRKNTDRAVLGFALMWKDRERLIPVERAVQEAFYPFSFQSGEFTPPFSSYYHREFGKPLLKKFVITQGLIEKTEIVSIKKKTVQLEGTFAEGGNRTVNIDPFYIDIDQLVVSTAKFRGNRIYAGEGVYLELELFYHHRSFRPFVWTYRDYEENIPFFNLVRDRIKGFFV